MSQKPIRMAHRIALSFEPGRGLATEVLVFPSVTHAKRYVRVKGLQVLRAEFRQAPNALVRQEVCP